MEALLPLLLVVTLCGVLLLGYPVAFSLGGTGLAFILGGIGLGYIDAAHLWTLPSRLYGVFNNHVLVAVPLFILMGLILERSRVADDLLRALGGLLGPLPGGLGLAVVGVGALLAASTGIVGATVVALGLLALPTMLAQGWGKPEATGVVAATGTLGQLIPPSVSLVLLGDVMGTAYQQAQLSQGIFSGQTVSVGQLFVGSMLPGFLLVSAYACWILFRGFTRPDLLPRTRREDLEFPGALALAATLVPPILLIVLVLGSILAGIATPTEASGVGALGAAALAAARGRFSRQVLREASLGTLRVTSMVFTILIGASLFSLAFREFGGDAAVRDIFEALPGGRVTAILLFMLLVFVLGFVLDFIEITFIVVPIVGPAVLALGVDPVWLAVMLAINLQTSFLTPPFGFALFYLRGVCPPEVSGTDLYRGVVPYILLQLGMLALVASVPELATWLPELVYGF